MMDTNRFINLLQRYEMGVATPAEEQELLAFFGDPANHMAIETLLVRSLAETPPGAEPDPVRWQQTVDRILGRAEMQAPVRRLRTARRYFLPWAAAILLLMIGGALLVILRPGVQRPVVATKLYKGDVQPGHYGAVLHLDNGRTVVLDSAQDGAVATQGTMRAIKQNGELKYIGQTAERFYNTVTTNRGRQWQLTLPDGTKVWLNAASSIRYPLAFTDAARLVEITGEAYFEVAHNPRQPFRVKAGSQMIEDIGTSFNINAYREEPVMKTTLVEGAIRIGGVTLKPGQQATIIDDQVKIAPGNIQQALAWKNGIFSFDHADIYSVMRELSRWYNVDVKFEGRPDSTPFQGEIGRSLTLAQVLKGLEQIHVHFRIEEDKRIVILP